MAILSDLSFNESKAREEFLIFLTRPDETLVLILWDDQTASDARDVARNFVERDESFTRFVNFAAISNPDAIVEELSNLNIHHDIDGIDLSDLGDFVIISISPFRNIISEAVTKKRFNNGKGSMTTAILKAIANG